MNFKRAKRIFALIMLIVSTCISLTSCYACSEVSGNQIGLLMPDGLTINEVVGSGRYSDSDMWANIEIIDIAAKTLEFSIVDAWSNDKQSLTINIALSYKRSRDMITDMWEKFRAEARAKAFTFKV